MRIQVTLSEQTGDELNRRAEAWGMDRSVLIEYVLKTWIAREHSITLTVASPDRAGVGRSGSASGPATAPAGLGNDLRRPQYASEATPGQPFEYLSPDAEDTQQCHDCAEVVPMSCYTPGMEHRGCKQIGANLVALRREASGLPPLD